MFEIKFSPSFSAKLPPISPTHHLHTATPPQPQQFLRSSFGNLPFPPFFLHLFDRKEEEEEGKSKVGPFPPFLQRSVGLSLSPFLLGDARRGGSFFLFVSLFFFPDFSMSWEKEEERGRKPPRVLNPSLLLLLTKHHVPNI